jgi:hypothetical protein
MSVVRATNTAIICAVLLVITGTQGANAQTPEELRAALYQSEMQQCKKRFPSDIPKTIVAKVECLNRAQAIVLPNFGSNRDLVQTFMADRMAMAERIQNKKMTVAEGRAWLAEKWLQVQTERQRRIAAYEANEASARAIEAYDAAVVQQKAADQQKAASEAAEALMWGSIFQALAPAPSTNVRIQTNCMHLGHMTTCN